MNHLKPKIHTHMGAILHPIMRVYDNTHVGVILHPIVGVQHEHLDWCYATPNGQGCNYTPIKV